MGADPNIFALLKQQQAPEGPLDQYTKLMSVQQLMGNNELQNLQRTKLTRDIQEEDATKQLFANMGEGTSAADMYKKLLGISPTRAMAFQKSDLETQKTRAELDKTKIETHGTQVKQLRDQTAAVTDDAGLAALRENAMKLYGPKVVANMPQSVNDPNFADWQRRNVMDADKFITQTTPKFEKVDIGGKVQMIDVNPVTNPAIKGTALDKTVTPGEKLTDERTRSEGLANRTVTMRGQNMTDDRQRDKNDQGKWANDLDRGVQVNMSTGETRPITKEGAPIPPRDAPEAMLKAAGYADRMNKAETILGKFAGEGKPGVVESAAGKTPLFGNVAANVSRSPERQQYHQAQEDWVRAKLRQESGAVIADEEMAREIRTYFPQLGDGPEVIKQKEAARETAAQAMATGAGRAAPKAAPVAPAAAAAAATTPPMPKKGAQIDGYTYIGGDPANPRSWKKK